MQNRKPSKPLPGHRNPRDIGSIRQNDSKLRSNKSHSSKPLTPLSPNPNTSSLPCKHCKRSQQSPPSPMLQILLDQNTNMKQQNTFLQQKVDRMMKNEKDLNAALREYQMIMSTLNSKNSQLHQRIQEYTQKTNIKVNRLKTNLDDMMNERKYYCRETAPISDYDYTEFRPHPSLYEKENIMPLRRNNTEKSKFFRGTHDNRNIARESPDENCEFERLLAECQFQTDTEKKKYLRKRLVDLVYQKSAVIGYLR